MFVTTPSLPILYKTVLAVFLKSLINLCPLKSKFPSKGKLSLPNLYWFPLPPVKSTSPKTM